MLLFPRVKTQLHEAQRDCLRELPVRLPTAARASTSQIHSPFLSLSLYRATKHTDPISATAELPTSVSSLPYFCFSLLSESKAMCLLQNSLHRLHLLHNYIPLNVNVFVGHDSYRTAKMFVPDNKTLTGLFFYYIYSPKIYFLYFCKPYK